jgi:CheY-like chemotaxis protein
MSSAGRAAALTHRLLAFSRRQTLDPRRLSPNRLVQGLEELVARTVGPNIALEVVLAPDAGAILCDPNQLENALLNLAINARDAMPEGGRLVMETANAEVPPLLAAQLDLQPGAYVTLAVADTGTGMSPEIAARAFDPFFTTKPIGEGTGLGLSMIYGFAKQSGGQVRIETTEGQGTTVRLYLPRHAGGGEEDEGTATPAAAPRAERGETVLVVDDEPVIRMLVVEVLQDLGYAALEAADGPAALEMLRQGGRLDLLVTDVGLPGGLNGRQLADAARASRPGLKVLFITGFAETAALGNGPLEPGMQLMTKPFALDALATRIRAIIEGE